MLRKILQSLVSLRMQTNRPIPRPTATRSRSPRTKTRRKMLKRAQRVMR